MLKMSHNDRPAFSLAYLFSQEFVCKALCCSFFFFLVPSISKPPAQPVRSLVLGLFVVPPCSDSYPVIAQPSSPPCEPPNFAWFTQTSFGMLFSDMDCFFGAALLAGKCNLAHPIVLGVSSLSLVLFLCFCPFFKPSSLSVILLHHLCHRHG